VRLDVLKIDPAITMTNNPTKRARGLARIEAILKREGVDPSQVPDIGGWSYHSVTDEGVRPYGRRDDPEPYGDLITWDEIRARPVVKTAAASSGGGCALVLVAVAAAAAGIGAATGRL
jgi:hypothetical protein